jgi:hypothetical protein
VGDMAIYIVSSASRDKAGNFNQFKWTRVDGNNQPLSQLEVVPYHAIVMSIDDGDLVYPLLERGGIGGKLFLSTDANGDRVIEIEDNGTGHRSLTELPKFY